MPCRAVPSRSSRSERRLVGGSNRIIRLDQSIKLRWENGWAMKAAFEIAAFVIAAGMAWLFSRTVKDKFERITKVTDQRTQLIIMWSVCGVVAAVIFLWPWLLSWLG
jgi:hypothetical protein